MLEPDHERNEAIHPSIIVDGKHVIRMPVKRGDTVDPSKDGDFIIFKDCPIQIGATVPVSDESKISTMIKITSIELDSVTNEYVITGDIQ